LSVVVIAELVWGRFDFLARPELDEAALVPNAEMPKDPKEGIVGVGSCSCCCCCC
jgi:hypothetical protein